MRGPIPGANCRELILRRFAAGPRQDRENPLGIRGLELHAWFMKTAVFANRHHLGDGSQGLDNGFAAQSFQNVGAWILGRNMFGPIRGPWEDDTGRAGGERSHPIMCLFLSSHIMLVRHYR
jgi:dihydrofolate reductase